MLMTILIIFLVVVLLITMGAMASSDTGSTLLVIGFVGFMVYWLNAIMTNALSTL